MVRHVLFDANYWKSFIQARLTVAMGDRGCLSLFGMKSEQHRLFAEHLTAEYRVKTVDEWKIEEAIAWRATYQTSPVLSTNKSSAPREGFFLDLQLVTPVLVKIGQNPPRKMGIIRFCGEIQFLRQMWFCQRLTHVRSVTLHSTDG